LGGISNERLNGKGYPEGITDLSEEEQIIAISDIYVAIIENRPYRQGMSHQEAMDILKSMASRGDFSARILNKFNNIIAEKIAI
jgi:HD-GYP domain-containing protein (c-di-GMP phosphodiesterase class II)